MLKVVAFGLITLCIISQVLTFPIDVAGNKDFLNDFSFPDIPRELARTVQSLLRRTLLVLMRLLIPHLDEKIENFKINAESRTSKLNNPEFDGSNEIINVQHTGSHLPYAVNLRTNPNPIANPILIPKFTPNLNSITNPVPNLKVVANPNPIGNAVANLIPNPNPNPVLIPKFIPNPNPIDNPVLIPNFIPNPNPIANPIPNPKLIPNPIGNPIGNPTANPIPNPNPNLNSNPNLNLKTRINLMPNVLAKPKQTVVKYYPFEAGVRSLSTSDYDANSEAQSNVVNANQVPVVNPQSTDYQSNPSESLSTVNNEIPLMQSNPDYVNIGVPVNAVPAVDVNNVTK